MAVNHRENMLRAISGRATERLPWVPRLDLWYRANKLAGTLPEAHRDSTLIELVDVYRLDEKTRVFSRTERMTIAGDVASLKPK